jgi:hypothetical protein
MSELDGTGVARQSVALFVEQAYGSVEVDDDGDFVVRRDQAVTWVHLQRMDDEHTAVVVFSPATVGVRVDGELTRMLATEDLDFGFAHFELHERGRPMVVVSHTVLGEYLSREELTTAVDEVAAVAARYGPQIAARFGGWSPQRPDLRSAIDTLTPVSRTTDRVRSRRSLSPRARWAVDAAALVAALAGALATHRLTSSWWAAAFVFVMITYLRVALVELLTKGDRWRRAGFLALIPVVAVVVLAASYGAWGRWWLAVVLGLGLGLVGGAALGAVLFADLADEGFDQSKEQDRRSFLGGDVR